MASATDMVIDGGPIYEVGTQVDVIDSVRFWCEAEIIAVDRKALQFEKDKLEAMPDDPAQKKIVEDAKIKIAAQIRKLNDLSYGCT